MSEIKVDNIDHHQGARAMTISSTGDVQFHGEEIDMWQLTADFSANTSTITGWARTSHAWPDTTTPIFQKLGTGLSYDATNGVFQFPKKGVYLMNANFQMNTDDDDFWIENELQASSTIGSGDSFSQIATAKGGNVESDQTHFMTQIQYVFYVTDIVGQGFRFYTGSYGSGASTQGHATDAETTLIVRKIASIP